MPAALAELPELVAFACLLVALALTIMVIYVVKAFFGVVSSTIGKLPIVGGWIDASGSKIQQRITNVLGEVVVKLESGVGAVWHLNARLIDWLGKEIARHAGLLALLAQGIPGASLFADLYAIATHFRKQLNALVHRLEGIGHDVIPRVKVIERGIGEDVLPRIKGLEREVHGTIDRTIPALRAGERAIDREITNLWKWTRAHTLRAGTLAFAGAVAWALTRLGLDWIKCNSAKQVFKKRGCGLWRDLDRLLGLVGEALLVVNICTVIPWLEEGFSFIAAPLISTLTTIGAGLCGPNSSPPELLPELTLALPAQADATLHLP